MGEDVGDGSVDRRMVGGFLRYSSSGAAGAATLTPGSGEGRNSSILSVSGTGSMLAEVCAAVGNPGPSPAGRMHETATVDSLRGLKEPSAEEDEVGVRATANGLCLHSRIEIVSFPAWQNRARPLHPRSMGQSAY